MSHEPAPISGGATSGCDSQFWICQKEPQMRWSEGKMRHMKALADQAGVIAAAAMDQRGSLQKSLASAKGVDQKAITPDMMSEFKTSVVRVLTPHATAI